MKDHPLFPPKDDDEDAPEVARIIVTRHEAGGPVVAPHTFAAEDLQSFEDIVGLFGGGNYELIARDARRITARRQYRLGGKSKPLVAEEPSETPRPQPAQQSAGADALVMTMMQTMMQMQQAQHQSTMQFLSAMVQSNQNNGREHVQAMQQSYQAAQEAQTRLMSAIIEAGRGASGGGGLSADAAIQFIEMGAEMVHGQREGGGGGEGEGGGDLEAVTEGMNVATQFMDAIGRVRSRRGPPMHGPAPPPSSSESEAAE